MSISQNRLLQAGKAASALPLLQINISDIPAKEKNDFFPLSYSLCWNRRDNGDDQLFTNVFLEYKIDGPSSWTHGVSYHFRSNRVA